MDKKKQPAFSCPDLLQRGEIFLQIHVRNAINGVNFLEISGPQTRLARDLGFGAGVEAELRVIVDTDIVKAIVHEGDDHDLIVMGASNEWFLRWRLFGSIPDQIANNASVSVLMVRSE